MATSFRPNAPATTDDNARWWRGPALFKSA
jgi:hypothetical protein